MLFMVQIQMYSFNYGESILNKYNIVRKMQYISLKIAALQNSCSRWGLGS